MQLTNAGFEDSAAGSLPTGWTQVDILTARDHAATGTQANGSVMGTATNNVTVTTLDGGQYLCGGRSSVFYQQVTASAVAGHTYNMTVLMREGSISAAWARLYFTSSPQTSGLTVPVLSDSAVGNITLNSETWKRYSVAYTAPVSGGALYFNLESFRDVGNTLAAYDDVQGEDCIAN